MKVELKLQDGTERMYESVNRIVENDKYSIYIYGLDGHVIAIVNKGDIRCLLTDGEEKTT